MGARYTGMDADYTTMEILEAGTPVELPDWDDDRLYKHAIHITDLDDGVLIQGSKGRLVQLLEKALQQARALPDDEEDSATDDGLDESEICRTEGCGESLEDNEGWNGYCGNCADRIERGRGDE